MKKKILVVVVSFAAMMLIFSAAITISDYRDDQPFLNWTQDGGIWWLTIICLILAALITMTWTARRTSALAEGLIVEAIWNGEVIAKAKGGDTISIDGNTYFPYASVNREFLEESEHTSTCPWKGEAIYYHVVVDGKRNEDAAWCYPEPKKGSVERVGHDFRGYVAFRKGVKIVLSQAH